MENGVATARRLAGGDVDPIEQAKAKLEAKARERTERAAHDAEVNEIRARVLDPSSAAPPPTPASLPPVESVAPEAVPEPQGKSLPVKPARPPLTLPQAVAVGAVLLVGAGMQGKEWLDKRREAREEEARRLDEERIEREEEAREAVEAEKARVRLEEDRREKDRAAAQRAAWAAEPRRSPWDASVYCVVDELKRRAHDPGSIECSDWTNLMKTDYQGQRCWGVSFVYRGKNKLGATVRNEGQAWVVGETVLQLR